MVCCALHCHTAGSNCAVVVFVHDRVGTSIGQIYGRHTGCEPTSMNAILNVMAIFSNVLFGHTHCVEEMIRLGEEIIGYRKTYRSEDISHTG